MSQETPKKPGPRPVSNSREMFMFLHCARCVAEIRSGEAGTDSPRDYARFEVGWTPQGLQVWCVRHDANVLHVDFEGQTHPANLTAKTDA